MSKKIFELAGIIAVDGMSMAIAGLKDLDSQFKAAEKSFFKFGRQLSSAGAKLSTNLTAPIIGAAAAATLAAKSFGEYGDKILDMSNNTGLTTDAIQELKQVASDTGSDFESITDSVFKLTKSMPQLRTGSGEASATLRQLGVSVFDSNGKFRDTNALFPEIIKKLQNITGATDRAAAAQAIFGKGGTALLDVLSMTNKEFDASRKKAHDLGLVMGGDALKAADDFRVGLNDATAQLVAMGRQATLELLPLFKDTLFPFFQNSLIPALKSMAEKVAELARWFNGLDDGLKKTILGAVAFAAAAGPVLLITGKLIGAIANIKVAMILLQKAFAGMVLTMMTNPFTALIVACGAVVVAIGAVKYAMAIDKEAANMQMRINGLSGAIRHMRAEQNKLLASGVPVKKIIEQYADTTQELIENAQDLGFVFNAANGSEQEQLKNLERLLATTPQLTDAIRQFNRVKRQSAEDDTVALIDPSAEADLDKEKQRLEEIERINAEYDKRLFDAGIHSEEEKWRKEKELALIYVKSKGGDVALAAETLEAEHRKKLWDAKEEDLRKEKEKKKEAAGLEKEWTRRILESNATDKKAALEFDRKDAVAAAGTNGELIKKINDYYRKQEEDADKETAQKAKQLFMDKVNSFVSMLGNIGSGIASLFQQSTANKQASLDNQQQAERRAIESSTLSEKEKRKAIEALDKKQDAQQRAFRRKAAAESKKINIFESIMGTASAVINALGSAMPPLNFIYAGIVGAIGAAKTALIAAQPLPLAKGALVQGGRGGILAQVGEASQDELVLPVESGVKMLARRLRDTMRDFVPAPLTLAGAGGYGGGGGGGVAYHIGTFIGDDRGIKEFERRQLSIRNSEAQRKGQMA